MYSSLPHRKEMVVKRINIHPEATRFEYTPNSILFAFHRKVFDGELESKGL